MKRCLPGSWPASLSPHSLPPPLHTGMARWHCGQGIALVHRTTPATRPYLEKDGLHIWLLHHSCVEFSNDQLMVGVILVGYILRLDLQGHVVPGRKQSHCEARIWVRFMGCSRPQHWLHWMALFLPTHMPYHTQPPHLCLFHWLVTSYRCFTYVLLYGVDVMSRTGTFT